MSRQPFVGFRSAKARAPAAVMAKRDGKSVWTKEPTPQLRAQEMYSTWLEEE
jgi:hypothetical protein